MNNLQPVFLLHSNTLPHLWEFLITLQALCSSFVCLYEQVVILLLYLTSDHIYKSHIAHVLPFLHRLQSLFKLEPL